jgi:hypothetical protein
MLQRPSKPVVTARVRQAAPSRQVPTKPVVDAHSRAARNRFRPVPPSPEGATDAQGAAGPGYLQWAAFSAPNGEFGFGAYFAGDEPIGAYTWTPSRRR